MLGGLKSASDKLSDALADLDLEPFDLFVFDFDGTITQPLEIDWPSMKMALLFDLEHYRPEKSHIADILYKVREVKGVGALSGAFEIIRKYEEGSIEKAQLRNEVIDLIRTWREKGKKMAVFSVTLKETTEKILEKFQVSDLFEMVVAREDVELYKPDSQGLKIILSELKISINRAIFFGDEKDKDMAAGNSLGVKTVII